MKKRLFLCAIGALLLASCANDDLVVKPAASDSAAPIAFNMKVGNISRNEALNDAGYNNFGVWAIKANSDDALKGIDLDPTTGSELLVMPNYVVNYDASTTAYGSNWSYVTGNQNLKYWDGSYTSTYFFAYAPHKTSDVSLSVSDTGVATLEFPTFTMSRNLANDYIYANARVENNAAHVTKVTTGSAPNTVDNPLKVPLTFNHALSQVKIALYEAIDGYSVKMASLTFTGEAAGTTHGIVAIPADISGTPASATKGNYLYSGTPYVEYSGTGFTTSTLGFKNGTMQDENLEFALPVDASNAVVTIGETYNTKTPSATVYNVLPNTGSIPMTDGQIYAANSGLQFVMNFDLYSADTNEVIHVKGARVYVDPTYTAWAPNKVYTYVFRITKAASGTTTDTDPDPDPDPDPDNALFPIIFDHITVVDMTPGNTEDEWDVNPEGTTTNPHDHTIH